LMLDIWVLKTKERPTWHMSFPPQEVVRHEVWTGGCKKKHSYKWRFSTKRGVVKYSPKWVGAVYFSTTICGSKSKNSRQCKDFYRTWSTAGNLKSIVGE
jgi:hypothetical protein